MLNNQMKEIPSEDYYKKVLGSWIGRIAGDFVGAPLEFKKISQVEEKYGEITYFPEPIDLNYVNDDEIYEICALIALENKSLYTSMVKKAIDVHNHFPEKYRKARTEIINYWNKIKEEELIKNVPKSNRKRLNFLSQYISEVHILPNIGIIILSLLYGAEDKEDQLGKSLCTAVMMGFDTDCNCGNVGSIIGAQLGAEQIPSKWKDPLKNTFSTYVKDYEKWKITELARRIADIGVRIINDRCIDVKIKL